MRPGFEADDILGHAGRGGQAPGRGSVIVTGDRDALQLVDDDVSVMSTGRGITDVKIYTPAAVVERFGVTPAQIPTTSASRATPRDNIPGVPGVGEKTAAALLQQFGSSDALYERLDEVRSDKRRALLREHEERARLSKRLATMVLDVPSRRTWWTWSGRRGRYLATRARDRGVLQALRVRHPRAARARASRGPATPRRASRSWRALGR